ncbi:MAG: GerAB/ArcD/ProY family transporter [Bacillota bacterium]
MVQTERISPRQLLLLIVSIKLSALTTYAPIITATEKGVRDSWLAAILAGVTALGMTFLACTLGAKFPRQTIFGYCETICGKLTGKTIGLTLICFFIYNTALCLRTFTEFILITLMPDTPLIVLTLAVMCIAAYMVRSGLEVIVRFNEIVGPPLLLSFPLLMILVAPNMDLNNLLPVLENGAKPMIIHALAPIGIFGEAVLVVLLALPVLDSPEKAKKAVLYGFLLNILLVSTVAASIVAVFGPSHAAHLFFPTFSQIRMISIANFLERLETIMSILFILTMFVKTGFLFYGSLIGTAQLFNLKDYKPLVLPLAVVITSLSMFVVENIVEFREFCGPEYYAPFALTMEAGLPLFLIIVAAARNYLSQTALKETRSK